MRFDKAQARVTRPEDPRRIACRAALGRACTEAEYRRWVAARWDEFAQASGCEDRSDVRLRFRVTAAARFDAWLRDRINKALPAHWRHAGT